MVGLGDLNSYDLGRVLEALEAERAEHPDQFPGPALRAASVRYLTWDHRFPTCWDDPAFTARYAWLRERLGIDTTPALADVIDSLTPLVAERVTLDGLDDEPF